MQMSETTLLDSEGGHGAIQNALKWLIFHLLLLFHKKELSILF